MGQGCETPYIGILQIFANEVGTVLEESPDGTAFNLLASPETQTQFHKRNTDLERHVSLGGQIPEISQTKFDCFLFRSPAVVDPLLNSV